jgi:hypothetical protein
MDYTGGTNLFTSHFVIGCTEGSVALIIFQTLFTRIAVPPKS